MKVWMCKKHDYSIIAIQHQRIVSFLLSTTEQEFRSGLIIFILLLSFTNLSSISFPSKQHDRDIEIERPLIVW